MVVTHPGRHRNMVARAQWQLVFPPDLGRQVPCRAVIGTQGLSQDHQGASVTRVMQCGRVPCPRGVSAGLSVTSALNMNCRTFTARHGVDHYLYNASIGLYNRFVPVRPQGGTATGTGSPAAVPLRSAVGSTRSQRRLRATEEGICHGHWNTCRRAWALARHRSHRHPPDSGPAQPPRGRRSLAGLPGAHRPVGGGSRAGQPRPAGRAGRAHAGLVTRADGSGARPCRHSPCLLRPRAQAVLSGPVPGRPARCLAPRR